MTTRRRGAPVAVVAVVAVLALGGCSGGSGGGGSSASDSVETTAGSSGGSAAASRAEPAKAAAGSSSSVRTRAVVRTGRLDITSPHLTRVRLEVGRLLSAFGGTVDREDTTHDRHGGIDSSTLVLRVPVARFDAATAAFARLGTVRSSTEAEKDVTTRTIDMAERVQTLQNSLDRLQRFQHTSTNVKDLIAFENEITSRQAELRSLTSQRDYLADQTAMSTITLSLSTPQAYVPPPGALDHAGFLPGLRGGWHALVGVVVVALTALGAALPFLVVLVLLGIPLWRVLRARRAVTD